ncbi:UNVERIFIED_CONTAM: hypothetical protein Sradi_6372400 [Sesamum radiatum]|uniref:Uncharacterized protein n=1 Tax=Sesamum radiatum TaxID=300843 RepID=A0AAW2K4R6_SESRA
MAYFWPARSKWGVGPWCLGESLGFMALRVEGTASGWFHRAAITSRSLQWKDNEPVPLGSIKASWIENFDLPLPLYKESSNIYVNRLWSMPDMKSERGWARMKHNRNDMFKHQEQELLKLASPPVEIWLILSVGMSLRSQLLNN